MSVQALGVLGGSDVRIDTYVDRYIPLEVSRIASMGLSLYIYIYIYIFASVAPGPGGAPVNSAR